MVKGGITDIERKLVFCRLGGPCCLAGRGWRLGHSVDSNGCHPWSSWPKSSLPNAADYRNVGFGWAGLRPMAPSSVPCITRPGPEIILNMGRGMLG